jgi:hypothetical protein
MSDARVSYVADGGPDDLPRSVLREREARYREDMARTAAQAAAQPAARSRAGASELHVPPPTLAADPAMKRPMVGDGVVRVLDIPFWRLVMFGFKLVFASIPAFILLGVLIWFAMTLLQLYYPELTKMQILINFPK